MGNCVVKVKISKYKGILCLCFYVLLLTYIRDIETKITVLTLLDFRGDYLLTNLLHGMLVCYFMIHWYFFEFYIETYDDILLETMSQFNFFVPLLFTYVITMENRFFFFFPLIYMWLNTRIYTFIIYIYTHIILSA